MPVRLKPTADYTVSANKKAMLQDNASYETVNPMFRSWPYLIGLLVNLDVIDIDFNKHSISRQANLLSTGTTPKGHWMPLTNVTLSNDYIEIVALLKKKIRVI